MERVKGGRMSPGSLDGDAPLGVLVLLGGGALTPPLPALVPLPCAAPHCAFLLVACRYGRAPAAFSRANVYLWSGILRLVARFDPAYDFPPNPPRAPAEPRLYGNWTSAYVESVEAVRYGFFEVRSRYVDDLVSPFCALLFSLCRMPSFFDQRATFTCQQQPI